ncbi:MAG: alpha-L-arabinofuranosidase [Ruminococcaceae bacterium]|nr:alpha-L-arabinofuranosidase [Oscillospiraceae bacterium]
MITIKIDAKKKHKISPYLYMQFMEPLSATDTSVDAGWDYTKNEWYPSLIEKVKELSPTMVRFGGTFAAYYHWKEAIGEQKDRIPMINHCWGGLYSNAVGTDEVIDFCRQVEAEPLLVVNTESDGFDIWANPRGDGNRLGIAEEAAEWVDYCNNPENPLRRKNGTENPFNVKYWQIGNETSYKICTGVGFKLDECYDVTNRFAEKMRNVDPDIKLIGWGDRSYDDVNWCKRMSEIESIDMLAFHHHFGGEKYGRLYGNDYRLDSEKTWEILMSAHEDLDEHIKTMRADCGNKRLALTEGHFILAGRNRNEILSSWAAGVAYARCLNTIMRHSDVLDIATMADFFGNVWQVNAILIPGALKWEHFKPYLQPVGSVMSLFKKHQGEYTLDINYNGNIDAVASATDNKIFIHIANLNMNSSNEITFDLGDKKAKKIKMHYITENPTTEVTMLNPDIFAPKTIESQNLNFKLPAAAVAAIEIEVE